MRKLSSLTLAILTGLSGQAFAAQMIEVDQAKAIDNKYIVVFDAPKIIDKTDKKAVAAYIAQQTKILSNQYNVTVEREFGTALNGVLVDASKKQIHTLLSNPNVKYIEQDQIVSVTPLIDTKADQGNAIWGLDRVDQTDLPLNSNYHYDYDGSGVTAYVIDTGVLISHNEFGNRASHGYDFIDNDNNATDCNGHGTHVAGTVGGNSYGVAKNVNVVGVRVLGCNGSGSNSGVIAGINWVKNNASGPSVANMSLGGGASQATDDAVNNAVASGISFVVAAGNDNRSACSYSPARAANAITVGSTTSSDGRSSFSNYGNCLDIYAPGSSIKSAWYNSNSATNTISGTSMATPHVSGVAALVWSHYPQCSNKQIRNVLNITAKDKGAAGKDTSYGYGIVQAKAAYDYIAQNGCADDPVLTPVANFTSSASGLNVSFSNTSRNAQSYSWSFGDGSSSSAASPSHTYAAAGSYQVTLTATGANQKTSSKTATVTVTDGSTGGGCQGLEAWNASTYYRVGDKVSYNNREYQASWWSRGAQPDVFSNVWTRGANCN